MDSIGCGTSATNPWRRTPMSSSLLSDPSTVKLFARERNPFTENCPAEPTPAPTPGPATLPNVCGGGATPIASRAKSSKERLECGLSGSVNTSSSENEPLRRPSSRLMPAGMSVSSIPGAGVGGDVVVVVTAGVPGAAGSRETGTGTTSPV